MKVMFFLPYLGGGGAEMHVVRLAEGLIGLGVEPIYVLTRGPGSYVEYLPKGVIVKVLDTGGINSSTLRLIRSVVPLSKYIDEVKPEVLCPVLPIPSIAAVVSRKLAKFQPKVMLCIQSTIHPPTKKKLNFVERVERFLMPRVFPWADGVIALSRGVANEMVELIPKLSGRVKVVYNVGQPLDGQLEAQDVPAPPKVKGVFRFLACGRLVEAKGYPHLIKAFAGVAGRLDAELHILGDGPMRQELESLASELGLASKIKFLGFKKNPFLHMKEADAFVLSSMWEGFGNVIVEAMTVGLPVVATTCPHGPSEIISDGVNGLLVSPGDPAQLEDAMIKIAVDTDLANRIRAEGYARAKDFSPMAIALGYQKVLSELALNGK